MSKIGKLPIQLEPGTQISLNGRIVTVTGTKGTLEERMPKGIDVVIEENVARVKNVDNDPELDKFTGLVRSLVANMVTGVSRGFEKKLELQGVGYRSRVDGRDLVLNLGFANPVKITPPEGITFIAADNIITIAGINRAVVGDVAAKIRDVKPPDAYKGKGLRYVGEIVKKKAGKSAKAVGGK